jgi:hypothetical protein
VVLSGTNPSALIRLAAVDELHLADAMAEMAAQGEVDEEPAE